jgi:CRP-like cAMP-binding protein
MAGLGTFYNTIHSFGQALDAAHDSTEKQEKRILAWFMAFPESEFTGYDIQRKLFLNGVPRHSISRALSNLRDSGFIRKTKNQVVEQYGKKNYTWELIEGCVDGLY